MSKSQQDLCHYDAIVVGAGFGGIRALYEMRARGLSTRLFEAAAGVGGTWYWNRYPGARTDSESWVYCFRFDEDLLQEWDWKERFPGQVEVEQYLNVVADRHDLRRDYDFETRIVRAAYD